MTPLLFGLLLQSPDPNVLAAEDYLKRGNYRKAIEALELVVKMHPDRDAEVYLMMAIAHVNLGDKTRALVACEQGLAAFPSSARIASYYVALVEDALPPAERRSRLEAALERTPDSPVFGKALGRTLLDAKVEDPRTEKLLDGARKAAPRDPEAHFLYGRWACLHEQEAVCVEALGKAMALTPPANFAAFVLMNGMSAVAEDRLKHPERARAAYERALAAYRKMSPPVPDVPYQYVKYLVTQSDDVAARKVNGEILARNPEFAGAHLEEARWLFRDGKTEDAVGHAQLALKTDDKATLRGAHSFLARAYVVLGRKQEARTHQDWVEANPE